MVLYKEHRVSLFISRASSDRPLHTYTRQYNVGADARLLLLLETMTQRRRNAPRLVLCMRSFGERQTDVIYSYSLDCTVQERSRTPYTKLKRIVSSI